jgi:hypothetical protein
LYRIRAMEIKIALYKLLALAAVLEIVYLVLVNLILNLTLTQTLINQFQPEKFVVSWKTAWSWLPFTIHAQDIYANGQSNTQQWQLEVQAASASISLLPLLFRSVRISKVQVQNVHFYQRPRPRQHENYAQLRRYFPPIRDRELELTAPSSLPRKKGKNWDITIKDIQAKGNHRVWIYQIQSMFSGDLHADIKFQAPRGPFSLQNGDVDISLQSLILNNNQEISKQGFIRGNLAFSPFVPAENKGINTLAFLTMDAELSAAVENLQFLDFYLNNLYGMNVDGAGKLSGIIHFQEGLLLPETRLSISAHRLLLEQLAYQAEGNGKISIQVNPSTPDELNLDIGFENIMVTHEDDNIPHFTGKGVNINTTGTAKLIPLQKSDFSNAHIAITLHDSLVPDLSIYQRYIPAEKSINLHGGRGALQGHIEITANSINAGFNLKSSDADLAFNDLRFNTNLELGINAVIPSLATAELNVSGSFLRLYDAHLAHAEKGRTENFQTALNITEGLLSLPLAKIIKGKNDIKSLTEALQESDFKQLMQTADVQLKVNGSVSDLTWLNLLIKNDYSLSINGSGKIDATIRIKSGLPVQGSILDVSSPQLQIAFLDYVTMGKGMVSLQVKKGGENRHLDLGLEIHNALLKRVGEDHSYIKDVELTAQARGSNLTINGSEKNVDIDDLHLHIISAKVTDMSLYDQYLPDKLPLRLAGGEALLRADIYLQPEDANGFVKLDSEALQIAFDEQNITADLTLDINIAGGRPQEMLFDISGSHLLLDNVKVAGQDKQFTKDSWYAKLILHKGQVKWIKPVQVQAKIDLEIKDSRPVVTIFSNTKDSPAWLEKLLTIENIKGNAEITLKKRQLMIPHAFASSDKIDIGAKGMITDQGTNGLFYLRYRKLDAILKIENDQHRLGILRAKKRFAEYTPDISE